MKKRVVFLLLPCLFLSIVSAFAGATIPVPIPRLPAGQSPVCDVLARVDLPGRILNCLVAEWAPLAPQIRTARLPWGDTPGRSASKYCIINPVRVCGNAGQTVEKTGWSNAFFRSSYDPMSLPRPYPVGSGFIILLLLAYLVLLPRKSGLPGEMTASRPYSRSPSFPFEAGFFNYLSRGGLL